MNNTVIMPQAESNGWRWNDCTNNEQWAKYTSREGRGGSAIWSTVARPLHGNTRWGSDPQPRRSVLNRRTSQNAEPPLSHLQSRPCLHGDPCSAQSQLKAGALLDCSKNKADLRKYPPKYPDPHSFYGACRDTQDRWRSHHSSNEDGPRAFLEWWVVVVHASDCFSLKMLRQPCSLFLYQPARHAHCVGWIISQECKAELHGAAAVLPNSLHRILSKRED